MIDFLWAVLWPVLKWGFITLMIAAVVIIGLMCVHAWTLKEDDWY